MTRNTPVQSPFGRETSSSDSTRRKDGSADPSLDRTGHETSYAAADNTDIRFPRRKGHPTCLHPARAPKSDAIAGRATSRVKRKSGRPCRGRERKTAYPARKPALCPIPGLGNCRFPLSFGDLATMLSINGHDVGIYDADFDRGLIGKSDTYEYTFSSQENIRAALQDRGHYVWKEIDRTIRGFQPRCRRHHHDD